MTPTPTIRRVTPDDFEGLVTLYNEVWPKVSYDKKKKTNFVINESGGVSYCAEVNGRIMGSRTSYFQNMYYGTRSLKCIEMCDTCVHKSLRGQGIFKKMNTCVLDDFFKGQNGDMIFNISVLASRKGNEKLGWHYINSLMALRKFVRPFHTLFSIGFDIRKLSAPVVWDASSQIIPINPQLIRARQQVMKSQDLLHIDYDAPTLEWRMKSDSGIKVNESEFGCVVYKQGMRNKLKEVLIGEIFLYDYTYANFKKAVKHLKDLTRPDILSVHISEGHPLRQFYDSSHFMTNPKQKYLHHGVRVESDEMKNIAYNPLCWAISSLDLDTF